MKNNDNLESIETVLIKSNNNPALPIIFQHLLNEYIKIADTQKQETVNYTELGWTTPRNQQKIEAQIVIKRWRAAYNLFLFTLVNKRFEEVAREYFKDDTNQGSELVMLKQLIKSNLPPFNFDRDIASSTDYCEFSAFHLITMYKRHSLMKALTPFIENAIYYGNSIDNWLYSLILHLLKQTNETNHNLDIRQLRQLVTKYIELYHCKTRTLNLKDSEKEDLIKFFKPIGLTDNKSTEFVIKLYRVQPPLSDLAKEKLAEQLLVTGAKRENINESMEPLFYEEASLEFNSTKTHTALNAMVLMLIVAMAASGVSGAIFAAISNEEEQSYEHCMSDQLSNGNTTSIDTSCNNFDFDSSKRKIDHYANNSELMGAFFLYSILALISITPALYFGVKKIMVANETKKKLSDFSDILLGKQTGPDSDNDTDSVEVCLLELQDASQQEHSINAMT